MWRGDKQKKDGKSYTGAVGGIVFPMVNGREGEKGDSAGEYVAAVERELLLFVPGLSAVWLSDTR